MSCSVYAAQYLMEALYRAGRANELSSVDLPGYSELV